jgi:hypothetical protein
VRLGVEKVQRLEIFPRGVGSSMMARRIGGGEGKGRSGTIKHPLTGDLGGGRIGIQAGVTIRSAALHR